MDNQNLEASESIINRLVRKRGLMGKLDAKCVECIYDPYQLGTWRKEVANCTPPTCPLYSVRPRTTGGCHA